MGKKLQIIVTSSSRKESPSVGRLRKITDRAGCSPEAPWWYGAAFVVKMGNHNGQKISLKYVRGLMGKIQAERGLIE